MRKLTVLLPFPISATVTLAQGASQEIHSDYLFGKNSLVKLIPMCGSPMARATQCWRIRRSSSTVSPSPYNRKRRNTMPYSPGLDRTARNYKSAAQLERKFPEARGLLMAGFDPIGNGATLARVWRSS